MSDSVAKPVYSVACPQCGSRAGEPCVVDLGKPEAPRVRERQFPHEDRIYVAKRVTGLRQVT